MTKNKNDISATWNDPDDAPELDDNWFQQANLYDGDNLIRRGRPISLNKKISTTIRIDSDIIETFKSKGKGWQTHMNSALRDWLNTHPL